MEGFGLFIAGCVRVGNWQTTAPGEIMESAEPTASTGRRCGLRSFSVIKLYSCECGKFTRGQDDRLAGGEYTRTLADQQFGECANLHSP